MLLKDRQIVEDTTLSNTRITADGYLAADVRCARTGIQIYSGDELGRPDAQTIRVYRPESEVFSRDSVASYAHSPVTDDHPAELVTADTWKKYSRGIVGGEVLRDGEHVRVSMMLQDKELIDKVQSGKREISMGYLMDLDFTPGETDQGEAYDAVMRNLKMNHLAVVDKGRAGPSVRIGDKQPWGVSPINGNKTMTLRTIIVDGLSVETTDQGAQAIEKLQGLLTAAQNTFDEATAKHDSAVAAKDSELAAKDTEIKDLKTKVFDGAALDKLVADRAALISKAGAIVKDADFTGKTDLEIQTAAVVAVHGADFAKDKSEAYINAAFDMLKAPESSGDAVAEALKSASHTQSATDNGQDEYEWNLQHAYLGDAAPKFPGAKH